MTPGAWFCVFIAGMFIGHFAEGWEVMIGVGLAFFGLWKAAED